MLTNNQLKLISSLASKKFRNQHQLFIVEGEKGIREFLNSKFELYSLFATSDLYKVDYTEVTENELKKISQLTTPNTALALFKLPKQNVTKTKGLVVALDAIRDPGNLGTIIRLCDWFGVEHLICSADTVDCYNPKVVQSTMGSLARIHVVYLDLFEFLENSKSPVYATMLEGHSIYKTQLPEDAILLMGNEAKGISEKMLGLVEKSITIPRFNKVSNVESLNVATATAICLNEFRRNFIEK
ncbi:RNA methyltransferase, TrmH family [Flavobacteriaceae bacterium MAR_2010_188]|nr:RNA methyltransferase, TrmH family [Flavobacteriaceae bacterium MAR_2010_188]